MREVYANGAARCFVAIEVRLIAELKDGLVSHSQGARQSQCLRAQYRHCSSGEASYGLRRRASQVAQDSESKT